MANIIAITGHKTEQRIKAYVDTDLEDRCHIMYIAIKSKTSGGKRISGNGQPWHVSHSLAPQFGFYNCSVTLGAHVVYHKLILK